MGKLFDTHAHYTDERLRGNTDLLDSLFATDISHILTVATDLSDTDACIALAGQYENIYASAGIHPHESGEAGDLDAAMASLAEKLNAPKVVALGEIGLDYHYDFSDRETQMRFFRAQMALAAEKNIPVIIHDREAHGDIMNVIQEYKNKVIGIIHCCSASAEQVKEYVKMGWYISFAGVITYKNASKTLESVLATPKDRILVETDCPYLAPEPNRGKRNDSRNIYFVIEKIAELKQMDLQECAKMLQDNARTVYRI
jgi:TatD DNase family protein